MQIKDIIKKRRKELNLTYEELGNMCGVGKTTVRKWELGLTENMKVDKIEQLSNALKISPLELLGYDSNFFNPTPNEPILVDKSPHVEEPKKLVDFYPNKNRRSPRGTAVFAIHYKNRRGGVRSTSGASARPG